MRFRSSAALPPLMAALSIASIAVLPSAAVSAPKAPTTTRISEVPGGAGGNRPSARPSISADGRFVAFDSSADNLVAGDTNQSRDVFVRTSK